MNEDLEHEMVGTRYEYEDIEFLKKDIRDKFPELLSLKIREAIYQYYILPINRLGESSIFLYPNIEIVENSNSLFEFKVNIDKL